MRIELCIPAYNERPIIEQALRSILEVLPRESSWNIVVADNASTDGTGDAVRALNLPGVSVHRVEEKGKGAAIIAVARASSADVFGFIDADLSADPTCIPELLQKLHEGADIAIGSRLLDTSKVERENFRTLTSQIFSFLRKIILGVRVSDTQCGLKFCNRRGLAQLVRCKEKGWFFDVEWLARSQANGLQIAEAPIKWTEHYFAGRASKLRVLRDGFGAIVAFVRIKSRVSTNK